ncbi:MAG: transglutaminase, partial [Prevotella sp.]|nr:transglutaminase [Prevotella sp.]
MTMLSAWWLTAVTLYAQTSDDKVVIANATDSYVFVMSDGHVTVKNQQETTYELLGNDNYAIQPFIFYDDYMTLGKASCGRLKPTHSSYTRDDLFFDGMKVCLFEDVLTKKHPRQTARFLRTFSDARRLARVSLNEAFFIRHKTVTVTIPQALQGVRIVGFNLPEQITMKADRIGTDSVFTFTITNLPAWRDEPGSPPDNLVSPYFLITGLFKNYTDLYRWG